MPNDLASKLWRKNLLWYHVSKVKRYADEGTDENLWFLLCTDKIRWCWERNGESPALEICTGCRFQPILRWNLRVFDGDEDQDGELFWDEDYHFTFEKIKVKVKGEILPLFQKEMIVYSFATSGSYQTGIQIMIRTLLSASFLINKAGKLPILGCSPLREDIQATCIIPMKI